MYTHNMSIMKKANFLMPNPFKQKSIFQSKSISIFKPNYFNFISYYGGKYFQLESTLHYIELVAAHNNADTYVELFGGGGKCILNLDSIRHRFETKIYNEYDASLCNLFQVVMNRQKAKELYHLINRLKCSKTLFEYCKKNKDNDNESDIDRAAMMYILIRNSYSSNMKSYNPIKDDYVYSSSDRILEASTYLKGVDIENEDYKEIMKKYGGNSKVIKYLDPPYHPACRNQGAQKVYPNELTPEQHRELVDILCKSRGWVLSGYDPEQYGCDDYKPLVKSGAVKVSIGEFRLGSSQKDTRKEEFIWYKY